MSSQKGNVKRTRPQKYKNITGFRNDLHDSSKQTKNINNMEISEVCQQCKDVIEWKIKFKKYKPLSQPKTCLHCHEKAIKSAYHTLCNACGRKLGVCCKCRQLREVIRATIQIRPKAEILAMMRRDLKLLPERKRRSFYRYLDCFYETKKKRPENPLKEEEEDENENEKSKKKEVPEITEDYMEKIRGKLQELMKGTQGDDMNDLSDDEDESHKDEDSSEEETGTAT